jgi:hypothetical protein
MKSVFYKGLAIAAAIMTSNIYVPNVEAAKTAANWVECTKEGKDCFFQ